MSASSTSIFVMFESCLVFFCLVLAFADFFRPKARMSRTLLECSWVGALSVFQMGGAISTVINGPASACHATSDWNVCASTSLLVPTTWLSGLIFLTYFLALFVATMAHKSIYPDIWRRPIYSIQWFEQAQEPPSKEKVVRTFVMESLVTSKIHMLHIMKTSSPLPCARNTIVSGLCGRGGSWAAAQFAGVLTRRLAGTRTGVKPLLTDFI
ncbi:hypothetical protein BDZ97DRAFT_1957691 [Flammula alnicola]|nr:hypothetical protein BDZ97DRAFT_1957691 [Flammula alnicola]